MTLLCRATKCHLTAMGHGDNSYLTPSGVAAGRLKGRVEHIASCESARFHFLEELLDFMARAGRGPRPGAAVTARLRSDSPGKNRKHDKRFRFCRGFKGPHDMVITQASRG